MTSNLLKSNSIKALAVSICFFHGGKLLAQSDASTNAAPVAPAASGSTSANSPAIDPASGNPVVSVPELADKGYKLAFSDEFNGTKLDENKWQYRVDTKGLAVELPANVSESGGFMHLAVKKEDSGKMHYTSAGIITKTEFLYGYYEARFHIPAGKGWHTSFYTQHYNGKNTGETKGRQEIDICEQDSGSGPHVTGYLYTAHDWGAKLPGFVTCYAKLPEGHVKPHQFHGDLREFQIWGMEYTPQSINFYFNGELKGSVDATKIKNTPMSIWLTTLGWAGPVDDSKLPSEAVYDYVRFFTKPGFDQVGNPTTPTN